MNSDTVIGTIFMLPEWLSSSLKLNGGGIESRGMTPAMAKASSKASNPADLKAIAGRLRALRQSVAASQVELCARAGIGPTTWANYEAAKNRPELDQARRLVDAFGVTLDWIYLGNESGLRHDLAVRIAAHQASPDAADTLVAGSGPLPDDAGKLEKRKPAASRQRR